MRTQSASGVLVLSGDDKPKTLACAIEHLLSFGKGTAAQPTIEMAWVRDVGGPGGVMIRFRTTPEILTAVRKSADALQRRIDDFEPQHREMKVTIRRAPSAAQFNSAISHQLVYRTDDPRGSGEECHRANRQSLEHFFAILARSGVDVAQYESVHTSAGSVRHAMRLFEYSGQGYAWLLGAIDRAHRSSIVVNQGGSNFSGTPEDILAVLRGEATPNDQAFIHPIGIAYQGSKDCPQFEEFINECARQTNDWRSEEKFEDNEGYIAVSVHGNDRPGFFIDCHRVLESAQTISRPNREVVRSCCRGLGQDGFVLAVARGFADEVDAIQGAFDKAAKAEFERLQVLAEHASAAWERAVFGTVYKTIFEPILPSVLVKFIDLDSLEPDQELMWTSRVLMIQRRSGAETTGALAEMVSTLSSEDHISINFLDVRGRDPTGRLLGCAIAIEHPPGLFKHVDDALNKAAGIYRPDGE